MTRVKIQPKDVNENDLTHLLDYDILREWGFVWASYKVMGEKKVVSCYVKLATHSTYHWFKRLTLSMHYDQNVAVKWILFRDGDEILNSKDTLFQGRIKGKIALSYIMKSCVIFKPNNNVRKRAIADAEDSAIN